MCLQTRGRRQACCATAQRLNDNLVCSYTAFQRHVELKWFAKLSLVLLLTFLTNTLPQTLVKALLRKSIGAETLIYQMLSLVIIPRIELKEL